MDKELLSIILIILLIIALIITLNLSNNKGVRKKIREKMNRDLNQINELIGTKNPLVYRDIIIRLDSLLSKALQFRLNNNNSCGENLKKARDFFDKDVYGKIWEVHKIRNKIVHEDKEVDIIQVKESYKIIYKAINKLI